MYRFVSDIRKMGPNSYKRLRSLCRFVAVARPTPPTPQIGRSDGILSRHRFDAFWYGSCRPGMDFMPRQHWRKIQQCGHIIR